MSAVVWTKDGSIQKKMLVKLNEEAKPRKGRDLERSKKESGRAKRGKGKGKTKKRAPSKQDQRVNRETCGEDGNENKQKAQYQTGF